MSYIACVSIEGVLADGDDLRTAPPTKWGRALFDGLRSQFRVIGFTMAEHDLAAWWVRREGYVDWAAVMSHEPYLDYASWKVGQIRDFLAEGWDVGMMLDIDQQVLKHVSELGVLTLTLSYPANRVGWRGIDPQPRSWSDLVDTI